MKVFCVLYLLLMWKLIIDSHTKRTSDPNALIFLKMSHLILLFLFGIIGIGAFNCLDGCKLSCC
uniref:Uncharacterized protein n=1 Tax=Rhizophora mucronata TaxID=61149 RepID=A0A2P2N7V1_RHIMU